MPIQQPECARLNRVAILGQPNAGKSTLTNQLVGLTVSGVSSKVHTTRNNVVGVLTEGEVQIELTDTPGFVVPKHIIRHRLEPTFLRDPVLGCNYSDIIGIVVDVSERNRVRIARGLLQLLYRHREKPSVLILNKIDLLRSKQKLIDISNYLTNGGYIDGRPTKAKDQKDIRLNDRYMNQILARTEAKLNKAKGEEKIDLDSIPPIEEDQEGWSYFSRVFMISALSEDGVDDMRSYFIKTAKPNRWLYDQTTASNRSPKNLVIDVIKAKVLDNLDGEAPYTFDYFIEEWDTTSDGDLKLYISIQGSKAYQISKLIGVKGSVISKIVAESVNDLSKMFQCKVDLKLVAEGKYDKIKKKGNN